MGLPFLFLYLKWGSDSKWMGVKIVFELWFVFFYVHESVTCHVLLDFDLCFSELLSIMSTSHFVYTRIRGILVNVCVQCGKGSQ